MSDLPSLPEIDAVLAAYGLMTRGAVPDGGETIVLVGHAGSSFWTSFARWRRSEVNSQSADPLDSWSRSVLQAVAAQFGASPLFPSDKPYRPFQRWAMEAEGLRRSPLGILIHPDYGLWHAYRGALVFDGAMDVPPRRPRAHPCDACEEKPCLTACPVDAFNARGFDAPACRAYLGSADGHRCLSKGCAARLACPVGSAFRYVAEQQAFHLDAFRTS